MKNYLTLLLFVLFSGSLVAQCDVTGGIEPTTSSEVRTNSTVDYTIVVGNAGSDPLCSYPVQSVKVRVSLPGDATHGLEYLGGAFASTYFDWTYNSTTKVITGINRTAIGSYDFESINLTFEAQEAPFYPRTYFVTIDVTNNDAPGAPVFPSNTLQDNDFGYTTVTILPENIVVNVQCIGEVVAPATNELPTSSCSPVEPTETVTTSVDGCGNGTREYLYTYTDCSTGGTTNQGFTWSYTYNILDNVVPTFTAPGNMTVDLNSSCELVVPDLVLLVTDEADNCDVSPVVTQNPAMGSIIPLSHGSTQDVDITVTDCSGNLITKTVILTANDATAPIITCPTTITVQNPGDRDPYATGMATATDNCSGVLVTYTEDRAGLTTTGCRVTGSILRTFIAIDIAGNTSTCTQTVVVEDIGDPVFNAACPSNITVYNETGQCTQDVDFVLPTAKDVVYFQGFENSDYVAGYDVNASSDWNNYNSELIGVPSPTNGITSKTGSAFGLINSALATQTGVFSRLGGYTAAFGSGFKSSLDIYIDFSDTGVANNTYGFDISSAVSKQNNDHLRDFIFHVSAIGQTIWVGASNNTNSSKRNDIGALPNYNILSSGWYTFEWDYKDIGGVLSVDLNLKDAAGTNIWTKVLSTATDDIATTVGGNRYMWFNFIATGSNELAIDNTLLERNVPVTSDYADGYAFPVGTTTVTVTATDFCTNTTTCNFNVTVIDNEAPVVTCPDDVTVNTGDGSNGCQQIATWSPATATDNCTASGSIIISPDIASGTLFNVGTTPVTYTATDGAIVPNSSTCSFNVIVIDNTPPVVTCPANVTVYTGDGINGCQQIATWSPATATDNCTASGSIIISSDIVSGTLFNVGTTPVTYTATDGAIIPNSSTCSFNVIVIDNTPPVFTTCPSDITNVAPNAASCQASIALTDPVVSDNCSYVLTWAMTGATIDNGSGVITSPYLFNVGTTTITYSATDGPNTVTCVYTVQVVNNLSATITGGGNTSVNAPTTVNVIFTGTGGTVPYTFEYTINGETPSKFVTTLFANEVVSVPHPNNTAGTFVYKIIGVKDSYGCSGTIPVPPNDEVTVTVTNAADLSASIPGPSNSSFLVTSPIREGYVQYTNGGLATTTGTVTFKITKVSNFTIDIPGTMMTSGNVPFKVNVDNSTWTIVDNGFYYTVSKANANIPPGGNVRIGYTLLRKGPSGSRGNLTTNLNNGSGGDNNILNNSASRTFIIN